ncbi:MAG: gluconate 2-dehydrogenase subunit 3 family protein [Acidobacteriota bacterium]
MEATRREFVYSFAALSLLPPAFLGLSRTSNPSEEASLTHREKEILGHFCEQIIPKDGFPGAREAGVVDFLDRVLREAHPEWVKVYRSGLQATEESSQNLYSKPFTEIEFSQQTQLLERMEAGKLPRTTWGALPPEEFFAMIRSHTMQGYYSHPKWGGNRNKAAWEMIGYNDWWV